MVCVKCGKEIPSSVKFCIYCGQTQSPDSASTTSAPSASAPTSSIPNTSGQGNAAVFPEELKGWSWGGFLWGWIWAIGNNTWIGLLALIPYIGFIMNIILGINGREWAWRNKYWKTVDDFKRVQRNWTKWWLIICLIGFVLSTFFAILSVAILSAINPAEQVKKAQDAMAKNNAIMVYNASLMYFSQNNRFPWDTTSTNLAYSNPNISQDAWLDKLVAGEYITQASKEKLTDSTLGVIKESGKNGNLYLCYQPASKANKEEAAANCTYPAQFCQSGSEYLCVSDGESFK